MNEKDFYLLDIENAYKLKLTDQRQIKSEILSRHFYSKNKQGDITALNLDHSGLIDISHLKPLKKVRTLSLRGNKIKDISVLAGLKNLESLDLCENNIEDIAPLAHLSILKSLNIEKNDIFDLTPLYRLIKENKLRSLVCAGNPLQFPDASNAALGASSVLKWFDGQLSKANALIDNSLDSKILVLDLGNCGLTDLSLLPRLKDCVHLEELILSNEWADYIDGQWERATSGNYGPANNISRFPAELELLKNLKSLTCGGDWKSPDLSIRWNRWRIASFDPFASFKQLTYLNISNNQIPGTISISPLQNLEYLHLNNNRLQGVRAGKQMQSLKEVYLSNNELSDGAFVNALPFIQTVDLHSNAISDLTSMEKKLRRMAIEDAKWKKGVINIAGNPLKIPDMTVVLNGSINVVNYFRRLKAERSANMQSVKSRDLKLILVGSSNVGKSTLANYLRTGKIRTEDGSTHWMEVQPWTWNVNGQVYHIRLFDFGGQEYYHDTHHLFFTDQTAYVLLWDRTSDHLEEIGNFETTNDRYKAESVQVYPVQYWLESIRYHLQRRPTSDDEARIKTILDERDRLIKESGYRSLLEPVVDSVKKIGQVFDGKPCVLLIQNKVDRPSSGVFLDYEVLTAAKSMIFETTSISILHKRGLAHFKELLAELFQSIPQQEQETLGSWAAIKKRLQSLPKSQQKELSLEAFLQFCNDTIRKMPETKSLKAQQVNTLLFNLDDAKLFAEHLNKIGLILYYPNYKGLTDRVFVNQSEILSSIYDILTGLGQGNGEFTIEHVVEKLKKPTIDEECRNILALMQHFKIIFPHPSIADRFIAPLYLPVSPPTSIEIFLKLFKKPSYRFSFTGYIHKNVILEFFQQYGKDILGTRQVNDASYYWRNGLVLSDAVSNEVVVVRFFNGSDKLSEAYIDLIDKDGNPDSPFLGVIAKGLEEITKQMNVEKEVTLNGDHFVPLSKILAAEMEERWMFRHGSKNYNLIDFKRYLKNPGQMKKVFISYSKSDANYLVKLEKHLTVLKRNGTISTWNCRKLEAGDVWDDKIKLELDEADIIIFLVSDDFLATDYIWDIEIKRAIERQNADPDNVRVIPIVVRACFWEDSPLGKFNTAPGKAQVISTSRDIDEAFKEAVKSIKGVVDK